MKQDQPTAPTIVVLTPAELLALVRAAVREELAIAREESDLVDVAKAIPLSRRVVLGLCRDGKIHGAKKVGKRWLAKREDVEAFLASVEPSRPRTAPAEPWSPSSALARAGVRSQGAA